MYGYMKSTPSKKAPKTPNSNYPGDDDTVDLQKGGFTPMNRLA